MVLRGGNSNVLLPSYLKEVYDEVERRERISNDIENGEFLNLKEIRKMMSKAVKKGVKKKSRGNFLDEIDEVNFRSVLVAKAVEDAVKKTRGLLAEKKDVKKNIVEKPLVLELPLIALHGGNVNALMNWRVLRGLLVENVG
jgi:hypothetical protein